MTLAIGANGWATLPSIRADRVTFEGRASSVCWIVVVFPTCGPVIASISGGSRIRAVERLAPTAMTFSTLVARNTVLLLYLYTTPGLQKNHEASDSGFVERIGDSIDAGGCTDDAGMYESGERR